MNADGAEAIAYLVVDAEDALNVHVRLERRLDRVQLYAAPLRNCGNARRQAARKPGENEFDRSRSIVLGRKDLRVVCFDSERLIARLLGSEPEEIAYCRAAVCAIQPLATCAPLELGRVGRLPECCPGTQQRVDVDAVVDFRGACTRGRGHSLSLLVVELCDHLQIYGSFTHRSAETITE